MIDRSTWEEEFSNRLRKHEEELRYLYCELYHNDVQAYDYFISMLYRLWTDRPESLKKIDRAREAEPDWYKGNSLTGMLMYVNAFAGNLNGVKDHLDYVEDCKVNYLHLMPLLESPEGRSDGGYAVSDFRKVQSNLGTMKDLKSLATECHKRGISVCLDFVMNHTSEDHEWAKRAKAGEKEYQDRYFFYDNWDIPNRFEQTVPQVFPVTAPGNFSWCAEASKVVMTTFYPYQWDLNYANPVVFNDMTDNMLNLCNHGVDIIRLDAVPYIWKELGTNCRNLPQVHNLVRMMRMVTEIVCPGTLLLGEVVMEPSKVVPYFGTVEKPECHLLYNVTTMATIWHTVATQDVRLLSHQMQQVFSLPKEYTFLNYLRCHDDIGWGLDYDFLRQTGQSEVPHKKFLNDFLTGRWPSSFARGELYNDDPRLGDARLCGTTASLCGVEAALDSDNSEALGKAISLDTMLHAFMFTLSGIPVLYSGDEIGQENDYSYHDNPLKSADSRFLHRGDLDWAKVERRKKRGTVENKIFKGIAKLEEIRDAHRAFDSTADTWLEETGNPSVIGIGRYYRGEKIVSYFNFSDRLQSIWLLKPEKYKNLITGKKHSLPYADIEPFNFKWFSAEDF